MTGVQTCALPICERPDEKMHRLHIKYIDIKYKAKEIPSLLVNRLKVTEKLRFYVRSGIPTVGKVKNPMAVAKNISIIAMDDINRRITATTEAAIKRNREFEKNELNKFFRGNTDGIAALYELYNMLVDFKEDVNTCH